MLHLINKVYLSFDFAREGRHDSIICSRKWGAVAYNRDVNPKLKGVALTYEELVEDDMSISDAEFINYLVYYPPEQELTIYCDDVSFAELLLRWFKALLPNADFSIVYTIYKLTIDKAKLMHSQKQNMPSTYSEGYAKLNHFPAEYMQGIWDSIAADTEVVQSQRINASMEWLLATHLAGGDLYFEEEIDRRVRKIAVKSLAWEIVELKQNLIFGVFDLDEIFPSVTPDLHPDTDYWEKIVADEPTLKFLQDRSCSPNNTAIVEHYGITLFRDLWVKYMEYIGQADAFLLSFMNIIRNPDYTVAELIQLDIDTKFGTQLFGRSEYSDNMNPLLISYLYYLSRKGYTTELKKFALNES